MQSFSNGIIVELNRNRLRVLSSSLEKREVELDLSVVNDTKVLALDTFVPALKELIKTLKPKPNKVVFLIEEKDIYDRFFVVRGDDLDPASTLKTAASAFVGGSLDDLYYIFQKVSPFVYQFVGAKKDMIDSFDQIASKLNLRLEGILPTSFIFSKFVGVYDPFFFLFRGSEDSTLVASEYGGVYFSGTYAVSSELNTKMSSLIHELSSFNREKPVTEVYFSGEEIKIDEKFNLRKLDIPFPGSPEDFKGYERLIIAHSVVNKVYEEVLGAYFNLKNFTSKALVKPDKPNALVKYVAPALVMAGVTLAAILGFNYFSNRQAAITPEVDGISESSPSQQAKVPETKEATPASTPKVLDRSLVKVRIENGAGVAGVAGKAQTFVEKLGYKVVEVGNAPSFDFEQTVISVKESKKEYLEQLKTDLGTSYSVKVGPPVSDSKNYDVLVTIGKK